MTSNQPAPFQGSEQSPSLASAYAYAISHEDGTRQFFTSYDRPLTILNLPEAISPEDDFQVFLPTQIKHGGINTNDRYEERATTVSLDSTDERLRRFFSIAAAVKLKMWIIRIAKDRIDAESVDFETEALVVESGILSKFGFAGQTIMADLTPEPYYVTQSVPRFFCQRTCNHPLYGPGCGLNKEDWKWETDIVSLNSAERTIVVTGKAPDSAAEHFEGGMFYHPATGLNFAIAWSAYDGDNTKFKLGYWHPELTTGSDLTAYPGCRHTVADCTERFSNEENFGGFPHVPNKNPVTNGV